MVSAARTDPLVGSRLDRGPHGSVRARVEALGPVRAAVALTVGVIGAWLILEPLPAWVFRSVGVTVVVAGVLGIVALAVLRFEWFLWAVLLVRPLVDLTRSGPAATGSGPLATLVGGAVILVGAVWIAGLSREGRRLPLSFLARSLVLLIASSLVSVAFSASPVTSLLQVARTLGAVVIFLALVQLIRSETMVMRALVVLALSALGPVTVGLVQLATGGGVEVDGVTRISGPFTHPNSFGFFLVLVVLMTCTIRSHVPPRARWAVYLLLCVASVELVLTYSRGSWLVLVLGLLVIGLVAERRLLLGLPVIGVVLWVAVPTVQARLADLGTTETVAGAPANSASWRITYLHTLLSRRDGDLFFGMGPKMADRLTVEGKAPHNDAVRLFLEGGVAGLTFYLLVLAALVALAVRALRRLRTGFGRGLAVGFAACTAAFIADSMIANLITQFVLLIYVFGLAAVVEAAVRLSGGTETTPSSSPDGPATSAVGSAVPGTAVGER